MKFGRVIVGALTTLASLQNAVADPGDTERTSATIYTKSFLKTFSIAESSKWKTQERFSHFSVAALWKNNELVGCVVRLHAFNNDEVIDDKVPVFNVDIINENGELLLSDGTELYDPTPESEVSRRTILGFKNLNVKDTSYDLSGAQASDMMKSFVGVLAPFYDLKQCRAQASN